MPQAAPTDSQRRWEGYACMCARLSHVGSLELDEAQRSKPISYDQAAKQTSRESTNDSSSPCSVSYFVSHQKQSVQSHFPVTNFYTSSIFPLHCPCQKRDHGQPLVSQPTRPGSNHNGACGDHVAVADVLESSLAATLGSRRIGLRCHCGTSFFRGRSIGSRDCLATRATAKSR